MPALYWLAQHASLEQVGRASRFIFTRESLQRAIAAGSTIDGIVRFLETHSNKTLPQNVIYTLRDWARQSQASQVGAANLVLEFNDEQVTELVVTSPKLKAFNLRRTGPRSVTAPSEISQLGLWRALVRHGFGQRLKSGLEEIAAAAGLPQRRQPAIASRPKGAPSPALKNI
jgi:hypothetical protein